MRASMAARAGDGPELRLGRAGGRARRGRGRPRWLRYGPPLHQDSGSVQSSRYRLSRGSGIAGGTRRTGGFLGARPGSVEGMCASPRRSKGGRWRAAPHMASRWVSQRFSAPTLQYSVSQARFSGGGRALTRGAGRRRQRPPASASGALPRGSPPNPKALPGITSKG